MTTKKMTNHSVPVQFPNGTLFQVLLSTSDIMTLREILNHLFSAPASRKQLGLRVGETPLDIRNKAIVSGRRTEMIGILPVQCLICSTYSRVSMSKVSL